MSVLDVNIPKINLINENNNTILYSQNGMLISDIPKLLQMEINDLY